MSRSRRTRTTTGLAAYQVAIRDHDVPPRWHIAAGSSRIHALSPSEAQLEAVRAAHRRAGVPPWKPCVRLSLQHTTSEQA